MRPFSAADAANLPFVSEMLDTAKSFPWNNGDWFPSLPYH